MRDLEQKVEKHETEIGVLKYSFGDVVENLKENTIQSRELTKTLAVYITKHDGLEGKIKELHAAQLNIISTQLDHSNKISAMAPVVNNLRGFVWKVAGAVILGGGGMAAVFTAVVSLSKHT